MTPMILCARVPWPVPAVRQPEVDLVNTPTWKWLTWRCSWCGARVKVVA